MASFRTSIIFCLFTVISTVFSEPISLRWCYTRAAEGKKCQDMKTAIEAAAASLNLVATPSCIYGDTYDACVDMIRKNSADLVTLDGGHLYSAGKLHNLAPIVAETYGKRYGPKYYAVAVVKKSNTDINMKDGLQGKKSCHTGARRTAGWNVPVGFLLSSNRMSPVDCGNENNDFLSVARFFNESCVPGVARYNISDDILSKLCSICGGTGDNKCSPSSSKEPYSGYKGAFKCMADGMGDVAFVKHTTTEDVLAEGQYGTVDDYEYLCKDGSRMAIGNHELCHLGFNPAHAVVTRRNNRDIDKIVQILVKMSSLYGIKQKNSAKFQLFQSSKYNSRNTLFKDSTTELVEIPRKTYKEYLGDDYVKNVEALKSCEFSPTTSNPGPISFRWCYTNTAELRKCLDMKAAITEITGTLGVSITASCVDGGSYYGCMKLIEENTADLITLDGGDVYSAGVKYGLVPIVAESYEKTYGPKYYAVAVVKKSNPGINMKDGLQGKKSCHTGARRTAGWNVPVGFLLSSNRMSPVDCGNENNDFLSVARFFTKSCVPGVARYNISDDILSKLCSICGGTGDNKCSPSSSKEPYSGYKGAFKCMADGMGDVAFVKHTTTEDVLAEGQYGTVDDYEYLCKDGSRMAIGNHELCHLGFNPAHAVVTRSNNRDIDKIVQILVKMSSLYGIKQKNSAKFQLFQSSKYNSRNTLFKDSTTELVEIPRKTYKEYLGDDYVKNVEALKSCEFSPTTSNPGPISFRWCYTNTAELRKCLDMKAAITEITGTLGVSITASCVDGGSYYGCIKLIEENTADLITLDGGDVYSAGVKYGLVPIVAESYEKTYGPKYYAVAVVKKSNPGINMKDGLQGKKSCHTGARRTAGWNVPVGFLLSSNRMSPVDCGNENNDFLSVARFFTKSCVPGVARYNISDDILSKLCSICGGTGDNKCSPSSSKEPYSGYKGAFKCMADGMGDVAFVKHTTTEDVLAEGQYGTVDDYEYLCKDGSRMAIGNHELCHLGFNPAHAVVTRSNNRDIDKIVQILVKMSSLYGIKQKNSAKFQLFQSSKYNSRNTLFKDSTTELVEIPRKTYKEYLGDDYVKNVEALKSCEFSPTTSNPGPISFRWCYTNTAELRKCLDMKAAITEITGTLGVSITASCVDGGSYYGCIKLIEENTADLITLDGGDVYSAGVKYGLVPIVAESYEKTYGPKYYAVAVVKKSNPGINMKDGLQGKKSCHTGARRTAGWNVPVGFLLSSNRMSPVDCGNENNDFLSVARFFTKSCVPGVARYNISDDILSKLCSICGGTGDNKCSPSSSKEPYSGYKGAFKCMADGMGDVAFVKHTTTEDVLAEGQYGTVDDYEYLCKDGSRMAIGNHELCHLGFNPAHAVVTRSNNRDIDKIVQILVKMSSLYGIKQKNSAKFQLFQSSKYNSRNTLFKDSTTKLVEIPRKTYKEYLGDDYVKNVEALKSCEFSPTTSNPGPISFRWCYTNTAELRKCLDMKAAITEITGTLGVSITASCVDGGSYYGCMKLIEENTADLITLDGGDVYSAGVKYGLVPIVAESYEKTYGPKYYAVAVVKKSNTDINMKDGLHGKKSCHTGARRTAGWNVPVGFLLSSNRMSPVDCGNENNDFLSVARFFNESCVPGVKIFNTSGEIPSNLCSICGGSGDNKCSSSARTEPYSGYNGAFSCMADGKGDVAFVKHTTTEQMVGTGSYGQKEDYEYLCKDGSRMAIGNHESCNLGINPAHAVVTRPNNPHIDSIVKILLKTSSFFGIRQTNRAKFQMFRSNRYSGRNVMFSDSTVRLVEVTTKTYQAWLGEEYIQNVEALKSCSFSRP